ncbi:MAG: hypothetical protein QXT45_05720 [Candidatus Bilamarchaeaceae archaeon]
MMIVSKCAFVDAWSTFSSDIEFDKKYIICREFHDGGNGMGRCRSSIRSKIASSFSELPIGLYNVVNGVCERAFVSETHVDVYEDEIDIAATGLFVSIQVESNASNHDG